MSILSALRTQSNSIDDLAKLPQAMIMQMAQKGQIREDMLAPILARKAELAQASANVKAMQQQTARPTVMEQILTQNAMQEAPESARDMGVAQLPVREDMYAPQRMAGGGIVAFQDNPNQPVSADMPATLSEEELRYLEENPYLQRSRALTGGISNFFNKLTTPGYVGEKVIGAAKRFINESPEDQAKRFRTAQMARTGEIPMFAGNELTTKGKMVAEGRMKPNEPVTDVIKRERDNAQLQKDFEQFDKATALFEQERAGRKAVADSAKPSQRQMASKPQAQTPPDVPAMSKLEKMIMDEREAAKGSREEAKWARLLEAGLGIMGGESPYALTNIGKGPIPALRGFGEDIKGLRKEERERVRDLADIEKMRLDQDYRNKMLRVQEIAASKPSSTSEIIALGRKAGLADRDIMTMLSGVSKDPDVSARNIAMKAFYESPVLQAQYRNDVNAFLRAQGIGAGAGGQPVLNYVPGKGV